MIVLSSLESLLQAENAALKKTSLGLPGEGNGVQEAAGCPCADTSLDIFNKRWLCEGHTIRGNTEIFWCTTAVLSNDLVGITPQKRNYRESRKAIEMRRDKDENHTLRNSSFQERAMSAMLVICSLNLDIVTRTYALHRAEQWRTTDDNDDDYEIPFSYFHIWFFSTTCFWWW